MTGQDIEAQEAMARDYNPVLEGPLVGDRMSSTAIAEEYAKADPIYVTKTAALPHKYSHYRPVLGDGNCGWRAVGFSYFETLIRLRDRSQLEEEVARMISLNNLLATAGGFDSWLFEDMVEETTILLKELALLVETAPRGAADVLWQQFNKLEVSNSIVYHLRLLASSWMKANPILYQGFIPDSSGVEGYVKNTLMPVNQEIDHLGVTLLIDVLLKPIGFSVEIVYLDRSPGAQVNSHIFQPEDANGIPTNPSGPMIHLLYRPSHYDILYKDQAPPIRAVEDASGATNLQVNRATNFSQHLAIQSTPASMGGFAQLDILSCIPGFSLGPQPAHHGFSPQYSQQLEPYPPSPLSASLSPTSPDASSLAATSSNISASFPAPPAPAQTPFPPPTSQLAILTHNPRCRRPRARPASGRACTSSKPWPTGRKARWCSRRARSRIATTTRRTTTIRISSPRSGRPSQRRSRGRRGRVDLAGGEGEGGHGEEQDEDLQRGKGAGGNGRDGDDGYEKRRDENISGALQGSTGQHSTL
ncbi:hypothetical protein PZA11_006760 [Diplocarpon coronariae]